MSRETKIGMLTGLLVIVLVGVLLSEYLGEGTNKTPARMAAVEAGEKERKKLQDPPSALGTVPETFKEAPVITQVGTQGQSEIPAPAPKVGDGVVVQSPVVPVAMDPKYEMIASTGGSKDTVELAGPTPNGTSSALFITPNENKAAVAPIAPVPVKAAEPTMTSYVIAKGDNLTIISKKFYKSATSADLARIVAANKTTLKDEKSVLIVGKKLNIPDIAPKAPAAASTTTTTVTTTTTMTPPSTPTTPTVGNLPEGMMPGNGIPTSSAPIASGPITPLTPITTPKPAPAAEKVYVVIAGDNLTKISKKLSATNPGATLSAIMSLNKLTMDSVIKVGQKIKIPDAPTSLAASGPSRARI